MSEETKERYEVDMFSLWVPTHSLNFSSATKIAPHPFYQEDSFLAIIAFTSIERASEWAEHHGVDNETILVGLDWNSLLIIESKFGKRADDEIVDWGGKPPNIDTIDEAKMPDGLYLDDLHYFPMGRIDEVCFLYENPNTKDLMSIIHPQYAEGRVARLAFSRQWLLYIYLMEKGIEYDPRLVINSKYYLQETNVGDVLLDLSPKEEVSPFIAL